MLRFLAFPRDGSLWSPSFWDWLALQARLSLAGVAFKVFKQRIHLR
jgi:hypothetical protein